MNVCCQNAVKRVLQGLVDRGWINVHQAELATLIPRPCEQPGPPEDADPDYVPDIQCEGCHKCMKGNHHASPNAGSSH